MVPAHRFPVESLHSDLQHHRPQHLRRCRHGQGGSPGCAPGIGIGAQGQSSYVFHCDQPGPVGSFVAGNLQLSPVSAQGDQFSFYTQPAQASTAVAYGNSLAQIMGYFSDTFGAFASQPTITVAEMPDGSLPGYSAPGLLLISAREWTPRVNDRLLSQLAAGQWWGNRVPACHRVRRVDHRRAFPLRRGHVCGRIRRRGRAQQGARGFCRRRADVSNRTRRSRRPIASASIPISIIRSSRTRAPWSFTCFALR